jgi:hypothetical protein
MKKITPITTIMLINLDLPEVVNKITNKVNEQTDAINALIDEREKKKLECRVCGCKLTPIKIGKKTKFSCNNSSCIFPEMRDTEDTSLKQKYDEFIQQSCLDGGSEKFIDKEHAFYDELWNFIKELLDK